MNIAFNGIGCGWGNNGGTQSVFRMADALNELGVDTELWAHCPSRFTWFEPKTKVRVCSLDNAPSVDVLINSGCNTTMATYEYPRKKVGVQWLRGHEIWARPEHKLRQLYKFDMPIWGNSEWLVQMLKDATDRHDAEVQYCGVPLDDFYKTATSENELTIGGLWSSKPLKRASTVLDVAKKVKGARLFMFGNEPGPSGVDMYIQRPSLSEKRRLMSLCDVWLATSQMEGLHIPPMEAALCGAAVVAPKTPCAGVSDYCVHDSTGLLYDSPEEAVELIESLRDGRKRVRLNMNMKGLICNKVGSVEVNAKRMLAHLETLL